MFPARRHDLSARFVTLRGGLTLRVVESGAWNDKAVLLLHGWGASSYMWRDWFLPLTEAGYRVLAPDLPGHGLSSKPDDAERYTCGSLVGVIQELMDVEGLDRADIVAQSMAGTIAIALAGKLPARIRHLALVNPAAFGRVRMERWFRLVSPRIVDAILPRLVARWIVAHTHRMVYGDPSRLSHEDVDEYWAPSQYRGYARAMRVLLHVFGWERDELGTMVRRLAPVADRTLVLLGTRDRLVLDARRYVAALRARLPLLQVSEIEGGGHAVNEERPEDLLPLVLSFLADEPQQARSGRDLNDDTE